MTAVLGVDFTSAPRPRKPITVAHGRLAGGAFALEAIEPIVDWPAFERLLEAPGPWIGGFDFPFGLPREAVVDLGWPQDWRALVAHCARLGRAELRAAFDAYRAARPVGRKYPHRATDLPAGSHSPIKLVNPPVALMFLEGAPRLALAGVTIPGLAAGDPQRVAVEAYPGFAARAITRASYKADETRKQTPARRRERAAIVARLTRDGGPFGFPLRGTQALMRSLVEDATGDRLDAALAAMQAAWCCRRRERAAIVARLASDGGPFGFPLRGAQALMRSLVEDATGDRLDAALAAMQAAWCCRRRARNWGLPRSIDPLEGWIATARHGRATV